MKSALHIVLVALLTLLAGAGAASAEKRVALVIGNDSYENLPKLSKAANDARAVASTLEGMGYKVFAGINLSRRATNRKMSEFEAEIAPGDDAFFFFAGHGVSIGGENYLIPSDMPQVRSGETGLVQDEAHAASSVVQRIRNKGARTTFIVLDACRDNPFSIQGTRNIGTTRGLARTHAPSGVFILFSAGLGQSALDRLSQSDEDPNSVFTRKFLLLLATPGLTQVDLAKRLQKEVSALAKTVGHLQEPAYYDQIIGEVTLSALPSSPSLEGLDAKQDQELKPALPADAVPGAVEDISDLPKGLVTPLQRGWAYETGEGVSKNLAKAAYWYERGLEQENAQATNNLASLYLKGRGVKPDTKKALELYRKSAALGNAWAFANLGWMYQNGVAVEQNLDAALSWYRKSTAKENKMGQNNLGRMYSLGLGVKKSLKEAVRLYRLSANQGYPIAQNNLGMMYLEGRGVAKSRRTALEWFRKAAKQDHALAKSNVGWMYRMGWGGLKKDYAQALKWTREAANQGDSVGQNNLGVFYASGLGVAKSYSEAAKWYRKAADQGYRKAQANLGYFYAKGRGVRKSYKQAIAYYRKSAAQSDPTGQNNLGWMYENGFGVRRSIRTAKKYYRLAARQGHKLAKQNLRRLRRRQ